MNSYIHNTFGKSRGSTILLSSFTEESKRHISFSRSLSVLKTDLDSKVTEVTGGDGNSNSCGTFFLGVLPASLLRRCVQLGGIVHHACDSSQFFLNLGPLAALPRLWCSRGTPPNGRCSFHINTREAYSDHSCVRLPCTFPTHSAPSASFVQPSGSLSS